MTNFRNKLRASAIATEICSTATHRKAVIGLALALEDKFEQDDMSADDAKDLLDYINAYHKKLSAHIHRVSLMIDKRKTMAMFANQKRSQQKLMIFILIMNVIFRVSSPKNSLHQ